MSDTVISIENVSKSYRLGTIGTGTFRGDLKRWWAKQRGKPDPFLIIGEVDHGNRQGDTLWALKDINFQVQQGEALGIIGRNGAGKSTLLKILSEVTAPTSGEVKIKGRIASLLEVGTGFHPDLTGRENTYLNGAILGMRRQEIRRKFDEIVDFAGIEQFIDTPVKRYSSGMYVRLAFAVAAHLDPEILIVDEVLAVGDAQFQKKCLGKMGDVAQEGRTVLFVSHNMAAVTSLTYRSIWLDFGKIAETGSTQDVINSYLKSVSSSSFQDGFASLIALPRSVKNIVSPKAQFEWVRMQDRNGNQSGVFMEQDPITVELGIKVHSKARNFQFGLGVLGLPQGIGLFSVASPNYELSLPDGRYSIRMKIDPNYLRAGAYSLVLKMFADGVRQETLSDIIRFNITENQSARKENGYYKVWDPGPLSFDYEWGQIESSSAEQHKGIS